MSKRENVTTEAKQVQIPIGVGLALEENKAMDYFCSLSKEEQNRIIDQTHQMQSTKEIADFIKTVIPMH